MAQLEKGGLGGADGIEGEIDLGAIVRGEKPIAESDGGDMLGDKVRKFQEIAF